MSRYRFLITFRAALFLFFTSFYSISYGQNIKATWVSTAYNLDWPSKPTLSVSEAKAEAIALLDSLEEFKINTAFFQVRAAGDAFYLSKTEKWSYWLTGKQGRSPENNFDPLAFFIEEGKKRGIAVHAWFNLFRAVSHTRFFPADSGHAVYRNPEWFYYTKDRVYLDPGHPDARDYAVKVIKEVANNYEVEGIHLDDYFYLHENDSSKINDQENFMSFNSGSLSLADWRRNNINKLIKGIYQTVKAADSSLIFSISPFPIWRFKNEHPDGFDTDRSMNCYHDLYADFKLWMDSSWVDLMIPQLYWSTDHPIVNYKKLTDWWVDICERNQVDLVIGHSLNKSFYRNDFHQLKDLTTQIQFNKTKSSIYGEAFFRSSNLLSALPEIKDLITELKSERLFNFSFEETTKNFEVFNIEYGKVLLFNFQYRPVATPTFFENRYTLDKSSLEKGFYFIEVHDLFSDEFYRTWFLND